MLCRLVRAPDFERVLRSPPRARSTHFAVHHLGGAPSRAKRPAGAASDHKLSTGEAPISDIPVDDSPAATPETGPRLWLGSVIPKRHARRAVTRTLLKRQIRGAMAAQVGHLPPGLWVVRLRAPFDRAQFPAAASETLRAVAGSELAALLEQAARHLPPNRACAE